MNRIHGWVDGMGLLLLRAAALVDGRCASGATEALRVRGGEGMNFVLVLLTMAPTRPPPLLRILASPLPLLAPSPRI